MSNYMKTKKTIWFILLITMLIIGNGYCQQPNVITTAAPILEIFSDPHGLGSGNCGVASEADVFSMYYNPAKYAFIKDKTSFGFSFSPWLRNLVPDMPFMDLVYAQKLGKISTIAASIRYFTMGEITFRDVTGTEQDIYKPKEFALDFAYSAQLTEYLSLAAAARFIYSMQILDYAAKTIAGDLGIYYQHPLTLGEREALYSLGASITNIGGKMEYSPGYKDFLPTTLRLGAAFKTELVKDHTLTAMMDFSKLLVPTPPVYQEDPVTGHWVCDEEGNPVIVGGMSQNVSVLQGMIQSFYDAPGCYYDESNNLISYGVFREELSEIIWSLGMEYAWKEKYFGRIGYFHQAKTKGYRQFLTLGVGANFKHFGIDAAYLIPTSNNRALENTITLGAHVGF